MLTNRKRTDILGFFEMALIMRYTVKIGLTNEESRGKSIKFKKSLDQAFLKNGPYRCTEIMGILCVIISPFTHTLFGC